MTAAVMPMTDRFNDTVARVRTVMPTVTTVFLVVVFLGVTGCSLVMSANGTMTFAVRHHMPSGIQWAPVGALECMQVAGTIWWLRARGWSRLGAVLVVTGTASVTTGMTQVLYGWVLGLVASASIVITIHAIACVLRANQPDTAGHDRADDDVTRIDLDGWTKRTARDRARELKDLGFKISQAGTVEEIVARIRAVEAEMAL